MKTYTGTMNSQSTASSDQLSIQSSLNSFESAVDSILQTETQHESQSTGVTARHSVSESLKTLYEQFGNFMKWIRSVQNGESLPYNYQSALEESINMDLEELEFLYKEMRAAVNNVECLRNQRKAIRKEKNSVERLLKKIEYEENTELEKEVMTHDRVMFSKWESIKTSSDPTLIDSLLEEAEGKYVAMKNLKLLLNRRRTEIAQQSCSGSVATQMSRGSGGRPKFVRVSHNRLDTLLAARETRRKRARTRPAAATTNTIFDDVIPLPPTSATNSGPGPLAIRDSLEDIDQPDVTTDIRFALNSLFGSRLAAATTTTTTTTTSPTRQLESNNKATTPRSSDIHLVLTPILNDFDTKTADKTQ